MGAFGEKLRQQREQRGLSLEAISSSTKISTRMLRAIEDEHFDQLPGGVFNKGFVRAYARQVGLDEEEALTDYLSALRESQIQPGLPNFRVPGGPPINDAGPDFGIPERVNGNNSISESRTATTSRPRADRRLKERRKSARRSDDRASDDHSTEENKNEDRADAEFQSAGPPEVKSAASQETFTRLRQADDEDSSSIQSPALLSFLNLNSDARSSEISTRSYPAPVPASTEHFDSEHEAFEHAGFEHEGRVSDNRPTEAPDNLPRLVPWGKLVAFLLLITLALALWTLHRRRQTVAAPADVASPSAVDQSGASPANPHQSAASAPSPTPASTSPVSVPPAPSKPTNSPHSHPAALVARTVSNPPNPALKAPVTKSGDGVSVKKPPANFTLLVRATQNSWISITADGQAVAKETLIAPAQTSVRAAHEVVIKAGNSAGISFVFNGKQILVSGNPGEVRVYIFDVTGLRSSAEMLSSNAAR